MPLFSNVDRSKLLSAFRRIAKHRREPLDGCLVWPVIASFTFLWIFGYVHIHDHAAAPSPFSGNLVLAALHQESGAGDDMLYFGF